MLNELVQLVQINIREKLASYVSQGQAFAAEIGKTSDNFFDKPHKSGIPDFLAYDRKEYFLVNGVEEFPDIALHGKNWFPVILA